MKNLTTIVALVSCLAGAPAYAQFAADSFYAGFGVGRGNLNASGQDLTGLSNATVGDSSTTYTARAGWRFHPNFAVEAGYYDLGEYDFQGGLGSAPRSRHREGQVRRTVAGGHRAAEPRVRPLRPHRRGAVGDEGECQHQPHPGQCQSGRQADGATYGIGGHWYFTRNIGVFAEWMKNDKIKVDSYIVGVDFRF